MLVAKSLKGASKPGANQSKYAKQAKNIEKHYAQLLAEEMQTEFVEADFIRDAFLQYLICAFCYETQDWRMDIPFDREWLDQAEGRDKILIRGFLRTNSVMEKSAVQMDKDPEIFTVVTLYYFHH